MTIIIITIEFSLTRLYVSRFLIRVCTGEFLFDKTHLLHDIALMSAPGLFCKVNAKIRSVLGYWALRRSFDGDSPSESENRLNELLCGYPRNHNYRICNNKLAPGLRLYERLRLVNSACPQKLESFLDIGCCRGFYVAKAAGQPDCHISVGIDVHEPFISAAEKVKQSLKLTNAYFYLATLDDLAGRLEDYGGPFQTVLNIGTYHYLFWGSSLSPNAFYSHREILSRFDKICTDRVIFSARLEVNRLPDGVREKARQHKNVGAYNTADFLKSAQEFFDVRKVGYLGTYPLLVMSRKKRS